MFLRSKFQEMILRRRSRSTMNSSPGSQRTHVVPDQLATSSTTAPCDGESSKSATARALFASSPRLLHSSSLPAGTVVFAKTPAPPDTEPETTAFSMSPTSVLDAAAASFSSVGNSSKRRPWRENHGLHGLADALDCGDQQQQEATSPKLLLRSCSLDRRVEDFGVKNKSSWLPLHASCSGREATSSSPAAADDPWEMEPESEDYTCVISRGPNPRTVHIFGDRVVEADAESSPRPINHLPARGDRGFLSL